MSQKSIKRLRRSIRKETDKIQIAGLKEFIEFCYSKSFWKRVRIGYRIVFKKIHEIRVK